MLATRTTTGAAAAQNAEELVMDELVEHYRADIPDPADILPLMTMVPSSPGDPRFVSIATPKPATRVNEPGLVSGGVTAGYAETGDSNADDFSMSPHLLVCYTTITRFTDVRSPQFQSMVMSILMDKMDEVRNEQIIEAMMTGTNTARHLDDMTKSAEIAAALTTPEAIHAATRQSWRYEDVPGSNRVIVARPGSVDEWLNIAEPAAVGRLMMNGRASADGVPIIRTGHGARRQGFCGPMALSRMKEWDGAVYVSSRYEAGIQTMLLELFWNWALLPDPHAAEFYIWLDAS